MRSPFGVVINYFLFFKVSVLNSFKIDQKVKKIVLLLTLGLTPVFTGVRNERVMRASSFRPTIYWWKYKYAVYSYEFNVDLI